MFDNEWVIDYSASKKNHIIWNMAFRKWAIIRAVKFGRKYNEKT